ncbi:MAG: CDP-glucose 4,6-dehydratase [Pseudomonadota bacterium]
MELSAPSREFWRGQRVLLTGHTGFKGGWMALWLARLGAEVTGFAQRYRYGPSILSQVGETDGLTSIAGDLRDERAVLAAVEHARPTLVIHMAAQALVREAYATPTATWQTNVLGTLNLLEALRDVPELRAALVITTDKVYANDGSGRAHGEDDPLGGHDPYASSKVACEELVASYRKSFFAEKGVMLATARAGNVIGGGDAATDRIVPDIWRAALSRTPIVLRNPESTRPWQHVLDPLAGYLRYLETLAQSDAAIPLALNFAPPGSAPPHTVGAVTHRLCDAFGMPPPVHRPEPKAPHEMASLALDASLAERYLGWRAELDLPTSLAWTAQWYLARRAGADVRALCDAQISAYEALGTPAETLERVA